MVTGGFTGIGKAAAVSLAERGAAVALGSRTVRTDIADALAATGAAVYAATLDVRDSDDVRTFVEQVESRLGVVDILINAAGVTTSQTVCGHDEDAWLDIIDTNLSGCYRTIHACLPGMMARGWGRIINVGSTAATTAKADHAAYCASKSGVLGLSRAVALEGAASGVTSVVVSPTWVETEMLRSSMTQQAVANGTTVEYEIEQAILETPQQRLVQPVELGALIAFLCREEARSITMEDIQVNAGALW